MKKIVRFIPILAVIIGIIALTLQKTSQNVMLSEGFRIWFAKTLSTLGIEGDNAWWNTSDSIRRIGHVIEYFVLGFVSAIALRRKWIAGLLCIVVSLVDQMMKSFVPPRHFDIYDMGFDLCGTISAILIICVFEIARKEYNKY